MITFDQFKKENGIPEHITEEDIIDHMNVEQFNPQTATRDEWCRLLAILGLKYNAGEPFVITKEDMYKTARAQVALKMEIAGNPHTLEAREMHITLVPREEALLEQIQNEDVVNIANRPSEVVEMTKKLVAGGMPIKEAYYEAIALYAEKKAKQTEEENEYSSIFSKK